MTDQCMMAYAGEYCTIDFGSLITVNGEWLAWIGISY